jgi:hypothetical protein
MLNGLRSRLTYANVVATGALFVALGGGAYALSGIPDSGGTYHGCVASSGALRVVTKASSCQKAKTVKRGKRRVRIPGETAIAWNQQGRPGTNGANGVNGGNGINGANGATNVVVRTTTVHLSGPGGANLEADCNPGERAIGGGAGHSDGSVNGSDVINATFPQTVQGALTHQPSPAGTTPTAWRSALTVPGAADLVFFAICASP